MTFTANLPEILACINGQIADPHHILGLHEVEIGGKARFFARAFLPGAVACWVFDPLTEERWELNRIHSEGFFEGEITGRDAWFRYMLDINFDDGSQYCAYDPYSFAPLISDLDKHLFNQGTHYEIYEKLGAHFREHDGVGGVHFALWAPNAARVSVIGNFNNYDGRRHQMRLLADSGIWELFIPALHQFDRYKFEIRTTTGVILQKSDPYASFSQLRPSHNSLLFKSDYSWGDGDWLENRAAKNPLAGPMNIYEVNLGSWKKGEDTEFMTYVEMAHELVPYVKKMAYTHIELMPILEYPFDGSWGYQITGYYSPTSRYGTPDEFRYFVDTCHQNGIWVILDWVPAHFPKAPHGLEKFDGTALYEHEDPRQGEHPDWGTLVFNYGRKEVANFLIANALYWLAEFHLDGLRVDAVASMIHLDYSKYDGGWVANEYGGNHNLEAIEFVKHMNSVVSAHHPNALMIAEESTSFEGVTRALEHGGLGFTLKWNMGWMNDFLAYISKEPIHRQFHHTNLTFGMMYHASENFMLVLSHDEVVHGKKSLLSKMPGDDWQKFANLRTSLGYMYGHPGKKLIFMGGEFGQFIEWNEKRPLDWFLLEYPHHQQMQDFTRDLNHLYLNHRAFWHDDFGFGGFEWIDANDSSRSIVSFIRKTDNPDDTLIIICNFTPNAIESHRVGISHVADYHEILNSDDEKYGGSGVINTDIMHSAEIFSNDRQYSIGLRLPPLGVVILGVNKN